MTQLPLPLDYTSTLTQIKNRVSKASYKSLQAVNSELILTYFEIGEIVTVKTKTGWGTSVVNRLAKDLQSELNGIKGLSYSNLRRMSVFYDTYKDDSNLVQLVREIPWGQNIAIMEKTKSKEEREFYIKMCIQKGWSRALLIDNINNDTYKKIQDGQNNFSQSIDPQRVQDIKLEFKDEYNLDFIGLTEDHKEKELEDKIVKNIVFFQKRLGSQFAFVGRQFRLETPAGKEYFVDLLFYHRKLKCLVPIELKTGEFKAEYIGKLGMYQAILDDTERNEGDQNSIGLIICKSKDRFDVEYSLRNTNKPMGVATYSHKELPKEFAKYLPNESDLEGMDLGESELKNDN
ncbi:MAG: PDDEXK nuclease domain-containing protein [Patescibacteria group bacterium]